MSTPNFDAAGEACPRKGLLNKDFSRMKDENLLNARPEIGTPAGMPFI